MMAVGMAALASFPVAQSFSHIVGGPAGWTFGSNYAGWANITAAEPGFFNNDVLCKKLSLHRLHALCFEHLLVIK